MPGETKCTESRSTTIAARPTTMRLVGAVEAVQLCGEQLVRRTALETEPHLTVVRLRQPVQISHKAAEPGGLVGDVVGRILRRLKSVAQPVGRVAAEDVGPAN